MRPNACVAPVRAGDTIGALLNRAERTISYYKNGIELGVAFQQVSEERLYPCVGMQTQDEEVCGDVSCQVQQSQCLGLGFMHPSKLAVLCTIISACRHRTQGCVHIYFDDFY